jgi:hypothetical protein
LPFRRQHGGSFASGSDADNAGVISAKLNVSKSNVAAIRRTET